MQKSNPKITWHPSAPLKNLRQRAVILQRIRGFFAKRGVMEVETPLMCHTSVTDPFTESIPAYFKNHAQKEAYRHYLQTSPEYAMKRLLASGSGPIYQITKAFRQGEVGRIHNPEFTMIEWYRTGFNHHDLMDEVDTFLQTVMATEAAERQRYGQLFETFLGINPHIATLSDLSQCAKAHGIAVQGDINNKDTWLHLLMSHCIEPQLGTTRPCFIYDFPASQASLARVTKNTPPVASRFEVYMAGIELANGFHELQDAAEQRNRFEKNLLERKNLGLPQLPLDEYFLSALSHGLPDCAGVALGLDRLIMLATNAQHISEVISFDFTRS